MAINTHHGNSLEGSREHRFALRDTDGCKSADHTRHDCDRLLSHTPAEISCSSKSMLKKINEITFTLH